MSKKGHYLGGHTVIRPKWKWLRIGKPRNRLDILAEARLREAKEAYAPDPTPTLLRGEQYKPKSANLRRKLRDLDKE